MKKIIIYVLSSLFFQHVASMDNNKAENTPLKQRGEIQSSQSLQAIATQNSSWDNFSKQYNVPEALVEHVTGEKKQSSVGIRELKNINTLHSEIVREVCCDSHKKAIGESDYILSAVKELFQANAILERLEIEKKIEKTTSQYNDNDYRCFTAINVVMGLCAVGELGTIALFCWVINHCHHPWG